MKKWLYALAGALLLAFMVSGCTKATVPTRNADLTVTYFGKKVVRERPTWYTAGQLRQEIKTPGKKHIIFAAPWCPACKILRQALRQINMLDSVVFVNVDDSFANHLGQFYGVNSIPTMISFSEKGLPEHKNIGPRRIVDHLIVHTNK